MKKKISFSIALLCAVFLFGNANAQLLTPPETSQGTWPHVENGVLVKDAESVAFKKRADSIAAKRTSDSLLSATQKQQPEPVPNSLCGPNGCDAEIMWLVTQLLSVENNDEKMVSNSLFKFNYLLVDAKNGTLTVSFKTIKDLRPNNRRLARHMEEDVLREMWARINREHNHSKSLDLASEFSKQTGMSFVPDKRKRNSF